MVAQADYNSAFEQLGIIGAAWRTLGKMSKSFAGYEDSVYMLNDQANQVNLLKLYGLDRGTNTDTDGKLYVSIASSSGNWQAKIYDSSARSATVLVASATGSGVTAQDLTVTAQNSSGMTGTLSIAAWSAADADIIGIPRWNIKGRCDDIDPTDDSLPDLSNYYTQSLKNIWSTSEGIGNSIIAQRSNLKARMDELLQYGIAYLIDSGNLGGTLLDKDTTDSSGTITNSYTGVLKDLYDSFADDSQYFLKNTVSFGSLTSGSGQEGRITATTKTPYQYVLDDDVITMRCTNPIGSDRETFSIKSRSYGEAENELTLGQSFLAPEIGIKTLLLNRDVAFGSYSASSGSTYFAESLSGNTFSITGETSAYIDADNSAIYGQAVKAAVTSNITISYYSSSGRAAASKIATIIFSNPGNDNPVAKTVAAANGSGITISQPCDDLDTMPVATTFTWTVDLNLNEENDFYQMTAANDDAGLWMNVLGRLYKFEFQSTSSANQTISEDYIKIWEDFIVDKNHN